MTFSPRDPAREVRRQRLARAYRCSAVERRLAAAFAALAEVDRTVGATATARRDPEDWPFDAATVRRIMAATAGRVRWDATAAVAAARDLNQAVAWSWENAMIALADAEASASARLAAERARRTVGADAASRLMRARRVALAAPVDRATVWQVLTAGNARAQERIVGAMRAAAWRRQWARQRRPCDIAGNAFLTVAAAAWWRLTGRLPPRSKRSGRSALPCVRFVMAVAEHTLAAFPCQPEEGACGAWHAAIRGLRQNHVAVADRLRALASSWRL